jgi:hypothetical protein
MAYGPRPSSSCRVASHIARRASASFRAIMGHP